jgi:elongation factor Tu
MVDDAELLELVEMEVRELLDQVRVPRRRHPDHQGLGASWRWKATRATSAKAAIMKLADALDSYIPQPERAVDDAVPDAGRRRVLDLRPRHRGDRPRRARHHQGRRRNRDRRHQATTRRRPCTGVEMFRKLLDQGQAGDNVGVLLRGTKREDVERGQVLAKPGSIKPHTKFKAEVYVLTQGRGRPSHAVLQQLPPAVLLPHDGRDRRQCKLPEGTEMVMPGDNVAIDGRS